MSEGSGGFSEGEVELIAVLPAVNDLRQRLYPSGFRPVRFGPPLFSRANLEFHYWPFKGIVWSLVVHASIFTGMVSIPIVTSIDERPRLEEAVILDADDMNVLFFPLLVADAGKTTDKKSENDSKVNTPPSVKEGLSYPGVRPIFSEFPKPTNHIQTVLQPTLVNPPVLQPSLAMPNLVRLAPPAVEAKFKVPDASTPQARQPSDPLTRLDAALSQPARPLPAPAAEAKFKVPDSVNPAARPVVPVPVAQDVSLSGPLRPLAAPVAEPRFKQPDSANPAARPVMPVSVAQDVSLSGPLRPLAAPVAEPRFKVPDSVNPAARPVVPATVARADVSLSGPIHPLAAPVAEPRFKLPDPVVPVARPALTVPAGATQVQLSGPARPLAAPVAESRLKAPDSVTPVRQTTASAATTKVDLGTGPARPLAAPIAESKFKAPDSVTPVQQTTASVATTKVDLGTGPARPLAAPIAESKFKATRLRHTGPTNDSICGHYYESGPWDGTCTAARCSDCGIQAEGARFGCCVSAAKFAADHRTNERPANWTNTNTAISRAYCRIQTEDTGRGYACCSSRHTRNCPSRQSPFGTCDNAGTTCAAAAPGLCIQAQ